MEQLSPLPTQSFKCPFCAGPLTVEGFWLPGMHICAKTSCDGCLRRFYSHLPIHFVGVGDLHFDQDTLAVVHTERLWYGNDVKQRAAPFIARDPVLRIESRRPVGKPIVVSLIDFLYGHCLQRVFKVAELLDREPDADLIVIAPTFMEWLIPDGIAELWVVDIAPDEALTPFPALADRLQQRLAELPACRIADMWTVKPVDIARFTGVQPISHRTPNVLGKPVMTFSWRDDRFWTFRGRTLDRQSAGVEQAALLTELCKALRHEMPELDVAVTGYGSAGALPDWIADMRTVERTDAIERAWVERYSRSHVTMGVFGSNMLLPMAHSASCVQLATPNYIGALNYLIGFVDSRFTASAALGRIYSVPTSCSVSDIATLVVTAMQRGTRSLANSAGGAPVAEWIQRQYPPFRLIDAQGGVL